LGRVFLSPAFDNGTSLGWEILEENIKSTVDNLEKYIIHKKATHHIKRCREDKNSIRFIDTLEVINLLYKDNPKIYRIKSILNTDMSNLENDIRYLKNFDIGDYSLSDERIDFIISLIKTRIRLFLGCLRKSYATNRRYKPNTQYRKNIGCLARAKRQPESRFW
jgi:hypothetical protein